MKLVYTEQALISLEEALEFIAPKVSHEELTKIRDRILDKADTLPLQPLKGQKEPFLEHLGLGHRRRPLHSPMQLAAPIYYVLC